MTMPPLPTDRPVLAWYGDDFTGSGAVMEVLSFAGLPAVLFLDPPTPAMLARFPGIRAVGLASDARTRSPDWMRAELPAAFAALSALGAPILHYKLCSTLDSAPHIGSIGTAAEIGLAPGALAPLVVAAPQIGRWQAFGTLFARAGDGDIHRLDRHPTMSVHPVTPMHEADVLRHLAQQTDLPLNLIDLVDLKAGRGPARLAEAEASGGIVALDVIDDESLAAAGALLWQSPGFVLGSQGIEYALVAAWQEAGLIAPPPKPAPLAPVDRVAIVSGSCSPVTAAQIDHAEAAGFEIVPLDPRAPDWTAAGDAALAALARGRSPLVATARGRSDPAVTDGSRNRPGSRPSPRPPRARSRPHPRGHRRRRHLEPRRPRPRPRRADRRDRHRPRRRAAARAPRRRIVDRDRPEGRPDGPLGFLRPSQGRPCNRRRSSRRMRRNA